MFALLIRKAVKACLTELCIYLKTNLTPIERHPCLPTAFSGCWTRSLMHSSKAGRTELHLKQRSCPLFCLHPEERDVVPAPANTPTLARPDNGKALGGRRHKRGAPCLLLNHHAAPSGPVAATESRARRFPSTPREEPPRGLPSGSTPGPAAPTPSRCHPAPRSSPPRPAPAQAASPCSLPPRRGPARRCLGAAFVSLSFPLHSSFGSSVPPAFFLFDPALFSLQPAGSLHLALAALHFSTFSQDGDGKK